MGREGEMERERKEEMRAPQLAGDSIPNMANTREKEGGREGGGRKGGREKGEGGGRREEGRREGGREGEGRRERKKC